MIKIGENLTINTATHLMNEDQTNRAMIKHGWGFKRALKIDAGEVVMYDLKQGMESVLEDLELADSWTPLEGDLTSLYDVYKIV